MITKDKQTKEIIIDALREVFVNTDSSDPAEMKILIRRIPILCKSIYDIHDNIKEIKQMIKDADGKYVNHDQFRPIEKITYGLVALVLTAVGAALVGQVIL